MEFSVNFDELMRKRKVTSKALSITLEKMGYKISPESISKYRRGERTPNPEFIKLVTKILKTDSNALLGVELNIDVERLIAIVGYVSCGGEIKSLDNKQIQISYLT